MSTTLPLDSALDRQPPVAYDAFISFSSVDRRRARSIQRFMEGWVDKVRKRRLRVFLDETDLRGGRLDEALRTAAYGARTLVVCYSPAAAESRWVQAEVNLFREKGEACQIAAAIVDGKADPVEVGTRVVPGAEVRVHDLRRRWTDPFGWRRRLELLRLLAFVADVDLRRLRNWYLRRTVRNVAVFIALAFVPLQLVLNAPMTDWEELSIRSRNAPVYAIAAEADGASLTVASRFRAAGPQGFRNYIQVTRDALGTPRESFEEFAPRRRLLPLSRLPFDVQRRIPEVNLAGATERPSAGSAWACEYSPGRFVVVMPLAPSEEELDRARDDAADFHTPVPTATGSAVSVFDRSAVSTALVAGLSPVWGETEPNLGPSSPARGIAIAWTPEGELWLGWEGRDARESGGLWRRRAGQQAWEQVEGFTSVQSIDVDIQQGRTEAVWVAERHLDRWRGISLHTVPTRVVMQKAGEATWRAAPAPPFGTRSEVELVGTIGGSRVIRVDERLYRQSLIPLWRMLLRS